MRSSSSQAALLRFRRRLDLTLSVVSIRKRLRTIFLSSERWKFDAIALESPRHNSAKALGNN